MLSVSGSGGGGIGYLGAFTTTYVTDDPENAGWYQVDPHC